ncbi:MULTISPECIES: hypothetical protein [unclassified Janthinobacterium]|uniref:DUF6630 family protein n=1 Tax=unclassified Janthinobacterium TaxID=2610881 RepID=UPI00161BC0D1|nr:MULTISPECIES: hypothetical protein [unclassified Janthinobacterium]MBB5610961.1 hypothetical protein [Janthinobacterium sp. S3T4]MBB5616434.1 hypothetical protein [Janthinobacterium sp. S3M3]
MIPTAALFSTATLPNHPDFDVEAITGLAEWRHNTPMLFKLLVGAGTQAVAWPIYGDGVDTACVLAAPMAQAQASWQALCPLMELPQSPAIDALLAEGQSWLVLDGVQLIKHDIGTADYASALQALRIEAQQLHAALLRGDRQALAPLLQMPELGYWSASASAQLMEIEEGDTDELPFLLGLAVLEWVEDALCYAVKGRDGRHGLVTPYGRWIVPLSLGATELATHHAGDGWVTFAIGAAHGVLDLNGVIVLPPAPGALYVISPHLLQRVLPDGASAVLRLPDGALLLDGVDNLCQRDDGLLDFERQTDDADEHNVCGVMDARGAVLLPPQFSSVQNFGTKKKLAIVSQRIDGRFLFGLASLTGALIAPCQYSEIDCATTSSPPRVRKNRIYATDAQGHACMLTLDGKQVFTPRYLPAHHLRRVVVVQDDFLYVIKDGCAWSMDFTGALLQPHGSAEAFKADITAQLSAATGLNRKKAAPKNCYTPAQILQQADHEQLRTMAALLLQGEQELAQRCVDITLAELAADDPQEEYEGATPAAACFFLLWSTAAHALGHGTTLDWKAVDEVARIGQHIDLPALRDFHWTEREDGDEMAEGLAALARHLAPHGLRLVNMQGGEDTYYLGLVREQDKAAFNAMAVQAALNPMVF